MNNAEYCAAMENLDFILDIVNQLQDSFASHPGAEEDLTRIGDTTRRLQLRLCDQHVIEAHRQDTLDQLVRVQELIRECGSVIDDHQRASIGYACELAVEKVEKFRRVSSYASPVDTSVGEVA